MFFLNYSFILILLILFLTLNYLYFYEEYSIMFKLEPGSWFLVFLVFILLVFIVYDYISNWFRVLALFIRLIRILMVNSVIIFYFMFELLFTLIMFSILLLGYSLERLIAGYLMLFYSFLFSSPSLFILILVDNSLFIISWINFDVLLLRFLIFFFYR